jgi:hypothetical protein
MARLGRPVGVLVAGALVLCGCSFGVTGASDEPTDISARVSGVVGNTNADTTQWWFEYGPTSGYMNNTPHRSVSIASASSRVPVSENVSGLSEGATYHYRLCTRGSDNAGVCGADATFTTTTGRDSVTGNGVVYDDPAHGIFFDASVYALGNSDTAGPATGHALTNPGSESPHISDAGAVTCLRIVGNRAAVGFLADYTDFGGGLIPRVLYVQDNGPTGDLYGIGSLSQPYSDCPTPTDASFPYFGGVLPPVLTSGDFTIHDHASS